MFPIYGGYYGTLDGTSFDACDHLLEALLLSESIGRIHPIHYLLPPIRLQT